ncbi:MAG: cytochrome P450 [Candidatus Obscuribacter sp.]|nr:cytochrome P450 [Candidatus Obscuribacter sp.]
MKRPTFAIPDPLIHASDEFYANPYATFSKLREEAPVLWSEKGKYWVVSRYEEVNAVLRDLHYEKGFQRFKTFDPIIKIIPQLNEQLKYRSMSMLNQNPPDHTRLRSLVNKAFTPTMVSEMRQHIQDITDGLLDKVESKGEMDLIADFCFVLPVTVIAEMLGIPPQDMNKFKGWSHSLTEALEPTVGAPTLLKAAQANKELISYLKPLVESRRKNPQSDLISALVKAEEEGNKLSEIELMANLVLLLVAGHETTVNLIGNGMLALMRNPEQMALLQSQPELIDSAVDEFLRYDSPVQLIRRSAGSALDLGGQQIQEDDTILLLRAQPTTIQLTLLTQTNWISRAKTINTYLLVQASTTAWAQHWLSWRAKLQSRLSCAACPISNSKLQIWSIASPLHCAASRLCRWHFSQADKVQPAQADQF